MIHDLHGTANLTEDPPVETPRVLIGQLEPGRLVIHSGRRWRVFYVARGPGETHATMRAENPPHGAASEELVIYQAWLDLATLA